MDNRETTDLPRRKVVLAGIGAAGVVAALAACGSSGGSTNGSAPADNSNGTDSSGGDSGSPDGGDTSGGGGSAAPIKIADVPAGGGAVFAEQNVVVTQPTAGTFKAFSATCTHQGCQVNRVQNGTIDCPCHGSQYSITDGSVKTGPAPRPLAGKTVTVNGDTLTIS
ncbi:Rieske (2Fe-2S) protein [Rugosimonospora africana]|uniref:Cytochrome bc1 complex Rieske iron-sulfur subunit n=1 Tax=Rugosimonospora africana TaxID=556532 RepID=A0A8J3VTP6_9ACTN|nr:Rieske (2Fe-2S) protein [Rugosimonospora africana]GIH18279.1 iron-sulfur protein [Rugosimonospora africana]